MAVEERLGRIMDFLAQWEREKAYSPSYRDIGRGIGVPTPSLIKNYLGKLKAQGKIIWLEGIARTIRIAKPDGRGTADDGLLRIPFAGHIVAGKPLPVPDLSVFQGEYISLPRGELALGNTENLYALRVRGLSMIDALIDDGDIVIMKYQPEAENGDMVAARLKDTDEFTLKRYYRKSRAQVVLQPENRNFKPIKKHPKHVEIQGKVIYVLRRIQRAT